MRAKKNDVRCPHCNSKIECSTGAFDKTLKPKTGDFTVCIYCQSVLRFDENMKPVKVSDQEIFDADKEQPGLLAQLSRVRMVTWEVMIKRAGKLN